MFRALGVNRIFIVYWACGVLLAFFELHYIGASKYASFVGSSFPTIEALSLESVDPDHWRGYYVAMITLMLAFVPSLWLAGERERKAVTHPHAKPLAVLLIVLCLSIIWALTHLHGGIDNFTVDDNIRGRRLILLVMLKYRMGMAVFGSAIMTGNLVLLFIVTVAAPQALLFPKK